MRKLLRDNGRLAELSGSAHTFSMLCCLLVINSLQNHFILSQQQRFEKRLSEWYDLTARYKRQLFEMEKEDYLTRKRQDQKNQLKLQSDLSR